MQAVVAQPNLAQALRSFTGLKLWKTEASYGDPAIIVEANGTLVLKGTDLTLFLACEIEALGEYGPGLESVAVPYATLKELAGRLPKKVPVTLQVGERRLVVQAGDIEVALPGKPAEDFVCFPDLLDGALEAFQADPAAFRAAVLEVAFSASSEDLRPAMTAVLTRLRGGTVTLVAADGYRLAKRAIPVRAGALEQADILIPAAALKKLAALLNKAVEPLRLFLRSAPKEPSEDGQPREEGPTYNCGYDWAAFQCGPLTLGTNLVEARYPDHEAIIPTRYRTRLVVPRAELLPRLQVLAPLVRDQANIMVLDLARERLVVRDKAGERSFQTGVRAWQGTLHGFFNARTGEREGGPGFEPGPELLAAAAEVAARLPWATAAELRQGLAGRGHALTVEEARAILDMLEEIGVVAPPTLSGYLVRATDPEKATALVGKWLRGRQSVAFNAQYILDLVSAMGADAVAIEIQDHERPGAFWPWSGEEAGYSGRPDDSLYVVMPMQL